MRNRHFGIFSLTLLATLSLGACAGQNASEPVSVVEPARVRAEAPNTPELPAQDPVDAPAGVPDNSPTEIPAYVPAGTIQQVPSGLKDASPVEVNSLPQGLGSTPTYLNSLLFATNAAINNPTGGYKSVPDGKACPILVAGTQKKPQDVLVAAQKAGLTYTTLAQLAQAEQSGEFPGSQPTAKTLEFLKYLDRDPETSVPANWQDSSKNNTDPLCWMNRLNLLTEKLAYAASHPNETYFACSLTDCTYWNMFKQHYSWRFTDRLVILLRGLYPQADIAPQLPGTGEHFEGKFSFNEKTLNWFMDDHVGSKGKIHTVSNVAQ